MALLRTILIQMTSSKGPNPKQWFRYQLAFIKPYYLLLLIFCFYASTKTKLLHKFIPWIEKKTNKMLSLFNDIGKIILVLGNCKIETTLHKKWSYLLWFWHNSRTITSVFICFIYSYRNKRKAILLPSREWSALKKPSAFLSYPSCNYWQVYGFGNVILMVYAVCKHCVCISLSSIDYKEWLSQLYFANVNPDAHYSKPITNIRFL